MFASIVAGEADLRLTAEKENIMGYRPVRHERIAMKLITSLMLPAIVAAAMLGNAAAATERPPRVGEVKIVPQKPADAKVTPVKRRAVRQVLDDDVRPVAPAQLAPPALARPMPDVAPAPVPANCMGGSCSDPNGGRFNGGVGTTLISPQGKLCSNNGMTVQCF
jgi:hypothetical protein